MTLGEVEEFSNEWKTFDTLFHVALRIKVVVTTEASSSLGASPNLFHLIDPVCLPGVCLRKMSVKVTS